MQLQGFRLPQNEFDQFVHGLYPADQKMYSKGRALIEFLIDEPTPSLNEMLRKHWTADRKLKTHWLRLVWVGVNGQVPPMPLKRALITITRVSPRVLDPDNVCVKHLIDGLRSCGVLVDDTPEHITLTVRQEKGKAGTRVQIEAA